MADVWTFDPVTDTFNLALDGSGSGQKSRSRSFPGLEADGLHTTYMQVSQTDSAIRAFLEVVGGDVAEASETGSQLLTARGHADGSGVLQVRFGVKQAGAGSGGGSGGDLLDYASLGALAAGGWDEFNDANASWSISSAETHGAAPTSIRVAISGFYLFSWFTSFQTQTFGGFSPGQVVTLRIWARENVGTGPAICGIRGTGSQFIPSGSFVSTPNVWQHLHIIAVANGAGEITVDFGYLNITSGTHNAQGYFTDLTFDDASGPATAVFNSVEFCVGTGLPNDVDQPTEPPPPPPPSGDWPDPPIFGERPFGIHNGLIAGTAVWNSTVIRGTPRNMINALKAAEAADTFLMVAMGPEDEWIVGGQFSYDAWYRQVRLLYDDIQIRNTINAAATATAPFTKRRLFLWYVIDEPFHHFRYGRPIPYATVERMCIAMKTLFPDVPTLVRLDPTDVRYVRKMVGLDHMWAEYNLARGPFDTFLQTRFEKAQQWGHGLVAGLHYKHFQGPSGPSPRYITPTELSFYGGKMARFKLSNGFTSIAMEGWRYESAMFVPGFSTSLIAVRDEYAANQPVAP